MRHHQLLKILCLAAMAAYAPRARADYPIASHRYLADPSSLVTKNRVYIYCSNDDESPVEGGYNIPNVICVSSSDLKNWTDHGSVFRAEKTTSWAKKTWAPAAIERDGKFFLYFGNGGVDGKLIGTCKVENTEGGQTWKTATCEVSGAAGVQDLYLKFTGGDGSLFNLDYWKFE